ncbi:MAG: nuclear transport factor 2 family protein [Alphaproteobacteria bacterium]|nr:nuclear transport factor 2 family protein [Alphaproteobacteria bacterium]
MTPDALMRKIAKAFEQGELQPLFDAIDDNTVWRSGSQLEGLFRFGGEYRKYAGVKELISRIASAYTFRRFEPKETVAGGDVVWGWFDIETEYRPTRKIATFEIVIRWQVRNGKILDHRAFLDTTYLLHQQGELPKP